MEGEEEHTEGCGDTDNNTLALELLGEVDLVAWGVLDEDIEVGDSVALLHEGGTGAVEEGALGGGAGNRGGQTAGGEHDDGGLRWGGTIRVGYEGRERRVTIMID